MNAIEITKELVERLVKEQFPKWADLSTQPVEKSGNDNRTFHLGDTMTVRLPSAKCYASQIEKEWRWLPELKKWLSLPVSTPLAKGKPTAEYPFPWLVNQYVEGETISREKIADGEKFAVDLAGFLSELEQIETVGAPEAGEHNFHRGAHLSVYHEETEQALQALKLEQPVDELRRIWNKAIRSHWDKNPVWIHGDIAPGNLLMKDGCLCGIIDFGIMGVGDPACDYAMGWTFFNPSERNVFFRAANLDEMTIDRARGWALWKALITLHNENREISENAADTINSILEETGKISFA